MMHDVALWAAGVVIVVFQALISSNVKKHEKYAEETRAMLNEHLKSCSETPNKTIVDRIEVLSKSIDEKHRENKDSISLIAKDVSTLRDNVSDQGGDIKVLKDRQAR